jgi:Protein of unknown function DUF58
VTTPDAGHRSRGTRTVNALATGLVAGVCGVVVIRVLFGPRVVLAGAVIGVIAMLVAGLLSWGVFSPRRRRPGSAPLPGGRRLRTRVHPVGWFGPVVGSVVAMLAWAGVAHSSGSGWVQAVGALLAAVLVIGLIAPLFPGRRASLTCAGCPSDGEAGRTIELAVVANGPLRIRPLYPTGPVARATGPVHGARPAEVSVTPERRGMVTEVAVELATSAPFGLLWWAREVMVPLPRPLHVAPRLGEPGPMATVPEDPAGDAPLRVPAGAGEPRGVRPYRPGDTRRSVHWPATSHVGSLMVREKERQTDDPIVADLVLPSDPLAAEAECEKVMASLLNYLMRGQPVVLGTREADGGRRAPVRDRIDLGRRLARAVPPPLPSTPPPASRSRTRARRRR